MSEKDRKSDNNSSEIDKDKSREDNLNAIARAIEQDRNLMDFFVTTILVKVDKVMADRTKNRMMYARVIIALLFVIIAPAAWFSINNAINLGVAAKVEKQNEKNIELLNQKLNAAIANTDKKITSLTEIQFKKIDNDLAQRTLVLSLISSVLYLDIGKDYLREDINFMMSDFNKVRQYPKIQQRQDFPVILDKAISGLIRFNYHSELRKLEAWFPKIIAANPRIVNRLVAFYGEQLIGSIYKPNRWRASNVKKFEMYLALARGSEEFVEYLPVDILLEYRMANDQRNNTVTELVNTIRQLAAEQQVKVMVSFFTYSQPDLWNAPSVTIAKRIAKVTQSFLSEYRSELQAISQQAAVKALLENIVEKPKTPQKLVNSIKDFLASLQENNHKLVGRLPYES